MRSNRCLYFKEANAGFLDFGAEFEFLGRGGDIEDTLTLLFLETF